MASSMSSKQHQQQRQRLRAVKRRRTGSMKDTSQSASPGASREASQEPDVKAGIDYWETQPASLDGVLGGFGSCSLPRVDALTSRLFLLSLLPELSTVSSALRPLALSQPNSATPRTRTQALDVGAGIGRITATVLLHLLDDVVLLEPATHFVREALHRVQDAAAARSEMGAYTGEWKGVSTPNANGEAGKTTKSVTVVQATVQEFDPRSAPGVNGNGILLGRVGYTPVNGDTKIQASPSPSSDAGSATDPETGYDVIWCQWCLGHLSDIDLVSFFKRAQASLRKRTSTPGSKGGVGNSSVIVVKENTCREDVPGEPRVVFDDTDSSLTRSDAAWKRTFKDAGLTLIKEEEQQGFPDGLYPVKMYALR